MNINPISESKEYQLTDLVGTPFHNSWRSVRYTTKGKRVGSPDEWRYFENFKKEMYPTYTEGYVLCRLDKSLPFSKENCHWVSKSAHSQFNPTIHRLEYDGCNLTLREWSNKIGCSLTGLNQRFRRGKGYSAEEILFGKKVKSRKIHTENSNVKIRASKLLSQYRHSDKSKNIEFDLDSQWFIENILSKPCTYCGSNDRIGADRIDNSLGHTYSNIQPCCYVCNIVRGSTFTVDEMKILGVSINQIRNNRSSGTL